MPPPLQKKKMNRRRAIRRIGVAVGNTSTVAATLRFHESTFNRRVDGGSSGSGSGKVVVCNVVES